MCLQFYHVIKYCVKHSPYKLIEFFPFFTFSTNFQIFSLCHRIQKGLESLLISTSVNVRMWMLIEILACISCWSNPSNAIWENILKALMFCLICVLFYPMNHITHQLHNKIKVIFIYQFYDMLSNVGMLFHRNFVHFRNIPRFPYQRRSFTIFSSGKRTWKNSVTNCRHRTRRLSRWSSKK